jgi:hypothetical protein
VYTISAFSVIFLSVSIEKQVKCKIFQWQVKDDQKKLLKDDLLRKEDRLQKEKQLLEEKQPQEVLKDHLEEKLQSVDEDKPKQIIACMQAII